MPHGNLDLEEAEDDDDPNPNEQPGGGNAGGAGAVGNGGGGDGGLCDMVRVVTVLGCVSLMHSHPLHLRGEL